MAEELRELRISKQIPAKDMVAVVQKLYPKYDKTVQSKCENGDAYGVKIRPDAMKLLCERFAPERLEAPKRTRHGQHRLTCRISCRLENEDYAALQQLIAASGYATVQDWLTSFVEIYGNDRTIGFSNCERYFAKGTRGISGIRKIPALTPTSPNDFLSRLFAEYNTIATREAEQNVADQEAYEAAMAEGRTIIETIRDADSANAAMPKIKAIKHALTSQKEVGVAFNGKIKACGLFYDNVLKKYTPMPDKASMGKKAKKEQRGGE